MIKLLKALDAILRLLTADYWFITVDGEEVKSYV